jgi:hypothetical protein
MLEHSHEKELIEELWDCTAAQVELPEAIRAEFFKLRGAMPMRGDNFRRYHRYYMRGKALLKRGKTVLGSYTKDVSRQGVGFLSPVQLLPKEIVKLRVPTAELSLEVARCQRVDAGCFDCGARFALEPGRIRSTN